MGVVASGDGRVILSGVSWDTYECLRKNYENQSSVRLAYDNGLMEIVSPLIKHENINRALDDIVSLILDSWEQDFFNAGSTTFKKDAAAKGFEPDTCFYIQNPALVRNKEDIDIENGDPPPDLVIEIDLTASSLARNPIFAAIGVPEVWRYSRGNVTILRLTAGDYVEQAESTALAPLTARQLTDWLTSLPSMRRPEWTKSIRTWAESHRHS